jgi:hypothetical protein
MERNDERREWERYGRGPRERGEQRWERGEVGPSHTGAPERLYGDNQEQRRTYSGGSEDERRARSNEDTWPERRFARSYEPYEDDRWGREDADDRWGYQARPTRNYYEDERRGRAGDPNPRASQYGYRLGRQEGPRRDEGSRLFTRRGRPPRDYRRADDRIRDEIIECIVRDTDIDASDVEVQVAAGEVTLVGTVEDRAAKRGLEDVVERVFGVVDIHNNVKVRKSAWRQLGDRLFGEEGNQSQNDPGRPPNKA